MNKEILKILPRNQPHIMSNPYTESDVIKLLQEQAKEHYNKIVNILGLETNPTTRLFKIADEINKW